MAKILLNKTNLFHNLETITNHAGSKEKVAVVLKDNAYGHGLKEIATLCKEFGIKKAVVKSLDEAIQIEKLFDDILILAESDFPTYSHTFHIALNSLENISNLPLNSNVHIKVDTGMHRNGIALEQLEEAFLGLIAKNIKITGIFTHHRSADCLSTDFYWQNNNFLAVKEETKRVCEKLSLDIPSFHSSSSSAFFRHKNFDEDFARVGIATYGYLETHETYKNPHLKPVLSLWADKLSTRLLKKGQKVGYGATYEAKEDMVISTYNLGYGDGFKRLNESHCFTTAKGFELLGRVSMDNLSLNTNEEEVCIFDNARALAKIHNTIPYEIVTALNANIKKEIV